jgi:hypothetical protein
VRYWSCSRKKKKKTAVADLLSSQIFTQLPW